MTYEGIDVQAILARRVARCGGGVGDIKCFHMVLELEALQKFIRLSTPAECFVEDRTAGY